MGKEKEVESKAKKEAEKIFMKNNPQYAKTGYPKVDEENYNTPYGKEAMRVQKQVVDTRIKQYKATKPKTAEQIFKGIENATSFIRRKKI